MKNTSLTIITSAALAAVLLVGPAAAFAKDDKGNKNGDRDGSRVRTEMRANMNDSKDNKDRDRDDSRGRAEMHAKTSMNKSCIKALGHLVAPGWIAANGTTTVSTTCKLPFGLAVKLGLAQRPSTQGTTTADVTAPTISYIASRTGTTTAVVTWYTNERADTQLAYGTTTAYGSTTTLNTKLGFYHAVKVTGLTAGTTYHFSVTARDASGNVSSSPDSTFTTKTVVVADTASPTLSAIIASGISSTNATIGWTTNEPSTSKVYFAAGSTLNLGTASSISSAALLTNHSVVLGSLAASTTYSYAVQSQDAFGNTSTSATSSFVTSL